MMDIKPKSFQSDYETTFILSPELPEGDHRKAVEKFVSLIKDNGGEVSNIEHWGMRRLAYPISRRTSGYYAFLEFRCYGDLIAKLEQAYRYDDNVIRYLTVKLDRHSAAFNNKRREQGFGLRKQAIKR